MADNETIDSKYTHSNPVLHLKSTAGAFAGDLLELVELQGKLFRADAKAAFRQSMGFAMMLFISCTCLLGCLPVLVFGIASAISHFFEIDAWVAQLSVAGAISLLSLIIATVAVAKLTKVNSQFRRSSEEFARNLEWTKKVFKGASAS